MFSAEFFKKIDMKRKKFLKTACPAVVFGIFGVSLIQACSSDSGGYGGSNTPTTGGNGYGGGNDDYGGGGTSGNTSGVTVEGSNIIIDLNNSNFSNLTNVGSWLNLNSQGLLLIRVASDTIRAFDNCCPHQGVKTMWSYGNGAFTCANHGNSFDIEGTNVVECSSGASSGSLRSFTAEIVDDILTITK